jgi:asparagine synthase (glutamine-hydrolysing)
MCRIAGIVDPLRYQDQLSADVQLMIQKMIHGGPDGSGVYLDKTIALGHCRLSLLDLSDAAAQPMLFEHLSITFNGEIYNFQEIKKELEYKQHQFSTSSDTEVILHAYAEWGVNAFPKFNGMYAFALHDKKNQELFLVRDPNGIKPLYYYTNETQLIFASETRAFKNLLDEENNYWRTLFLSYGHLPEPYTKLKDVFALPKSSYLKYNLVNHQFEIKSFQYQSSNTSTTIGISDIKNVLYDSVKRHLISDASIGMFLSGGIDSSILTLLASESTNHLNTLSIYFNEEEYSEKYYQDIIVEKTKSKHHALLLDANEFDTNIENILNAYDLPSNDGVNTWFISNYAHQKKLKAVLSGLGADELFGGYPSFQRLAQIKQLHKYKKAITALSFALPGKFQRLNFLKLDESISDYLLLRGFYAPDKTAKILNMTETDVLNQLNTYAPSTARKLNTLKDVSDMEREMYMQNQLLKDSDVMSMQHGVEIRVPFLDNEFLHLLSTISENQLFPRPGTKEVLINAFASILPKEIYNRPKKGFQFPFKHWLKKSEYIKDKLHGLNVKHEYSEFQQDSIHWSKIWALTQL